MLDLSKIVLDYFKKNDLSLKMISKLLSQVKVEVIAELADPKDGKKYVISRNLDMEEYDESKIDRSIERASNFIKMPVTRADVMIISRDVKKYLKNLDRNVYTTSEIRTNIVKSLREQNYPDTAQAYAKQRDYTEDPE
ncbi:MAG: ATP cone domain-containing protein [Finegoldia sp.]|nr:ATP cone domain-containing protein [Finegoldia sp.]